MIVDGKKLVKANDKKAIRATKKERLKDDINKKQKLEARYYKA